MDPREETLETLGAELSLGSGAFDTGSDEFGVVGDPTSDLSGCFGEVSCERITEDNSVLREHFFFEAIKGGELAFCKFGRSKGMAGCIGTMATTVTDLLKAERFRCHKSNERRNPTGRLLRKIVTRRVRVLQYLPFFGKLASQEVAPTN